MKETVEQHKRKLIQLKQKLIILANDKSLLNFNKSYLLIVYSLEKFVFPSFIMGSNDYLILNNDKIEQLQEEIFRLRCEIFLESLNDNSMIENIFF